jgi:hypothetical protein
MWFENDYFLEGEVGKKGNDENLTVFRPKNGIEKEASNILDVSRSDGLNINAPDFRHSALINPLCNFEIKCINASATIQSASLWSSLKTPADIKNPIK